MASSSSSSSRPYRSRELPPAPYAAPYHDSEVGTYPTRSKTSNNSNDSSGSGINKLKSAPINTVFYITTISDSLSILRFSAGFFAAGLIFMLYFQFVGDIDVLMSLNRQ